MKKQIFTFTVSALAIAVLSGCSATNNSAQMDIKDSSEYKSLQQELASVRNAQGDTSQLESEIARLTRESQTTSLLPPNPKAGECYARVVIPAKYTMASETVQVRAAGQRIETTAPKYGYVEQRVLVKDAYERLEVVPATYRNVTETIEVAEASEQLVRVPAKYKTVTEKILVRPAHTEWKKGTGPIQKVDAGTGEIMCLVEVPAVYKTVTKTVMIAPESVKTVAVPGKSQTISRRVVDQPAATRKIVVPAVYKTIKVRKLTKAAQQTAIAIPAEYKTVEKRAKVSDAYLEWRSILCETNTQPSLIRDLQRALKAKGYNPGSIDGVLGRGTMAAVNSYQKAKGMASGQLTINTLKSLGVAI
ncbi:peptidoglycan-binding domain-containing protein [Neptunomonas japonica]|uniref:peptidoglycan-binding domain-containing protein n=1 Tax=Neptunomonas japonica TaxID=417574 RepID=UPI0003F84D09|nr:peptidoglycan-binding domain-containing protein [Neptunomonas japonica]